MCKLSDQKLFINMGQFKKYWIIILLNNINNNNN